MGRSLPVLTSRRFASTLPAPHPSSIYLESGSSDVNFMVNTRECRSVLFIIAVIIILNMHYLFPYLFTYLGQREYRGRFFNYSTSHLARYSIPLYSQQSDGLVQNRRNSMFFFILSQSMFILIIGISIPIINLSMD